MKNLLKFLLFTIFCCNFSLTIACQTKEQSVDVVVKECQQYLDKDDLDGASNCFQKAILSNPQNAKQISIAGEDAVFKKCVEFRESKNFGNTIICFEGLTELNSNSANIYFNLAESYYGYYEKSFKNNGNQDLDLLYRAENALKKGLEINPKVAHAHALYGEILKDKKNKDEMIKEYEKALELSPQTQVYWFYFAMALEKFNENNKAVKNYEKALELEPDDTLALYYLGKLYEKTGENDKAIEAYEKLLKLESNPDDAEQRLKSLKEKRDSEKPKLKAKSAGN